jgi:O-antigen/teichoic acid export membrane protein
VLRRYKLDLLIAAGLLLLPCLLFWQVLIGGRTLIPADNMFAWQPWRSFAAQHGVDVPHNELLSDLLLENYVWKRFILESFRQTGGLTNKLPLWNPYLFAGTPFFAAGQHSALYPMSVLFYVLPVPYAYGPFTVLQLWLAGVFMYIFARTLGINRFGATVAAVTYQLSAVMVIQVVFTMIIASMAWLPLLLALIEKVIRQQRMGGSGKTLPYVIGGAVALGCQILAGHVEFTIYTLLIMGVYTAWRLGGCWIGRFGIGRRAKGSFSPEGPDVNVWAERAKPCGLIISPAGALPSQPDALASGSPGLVENPPLKEVGRSVGNRSADLAIASLLKTVAWLALMVVLGVGLGAAQLFPLYEFASQSFRQGAASYQQVVSWAYPWRRIIAFLVPWFFGSPTHHSFFDVFSGQVVPVTRDFHGQPINTIYWGVKNAVEGGSYLGILPLFLALVAVIGRRGQTSDKEYRRSRGYVWFFLLLALVSLAFVFGTPLYRLLFALPFMDQLRTPFRWVFPYTLSVAVLAGCGAWYLSGTGRRTTSVESPFTGANTQRIVGWPVFWAGVVGLVLLVGSRFVPGTVIPLAERVMLSLAGAPNAFADGRMFYSYEFANLLVFGLFLVATGAVLRVSRCPIYLPERLGSYAVWKPLALMVLVGDLFLFGYGFNPAADPHLLDFKPPVVEFLEQLQQDEGLWRFATFCPRGEPTFHANAGMFYDLSDVRGYDSLISKQYADYMGLIELQGWLQYNRIAPFSNPRSLDSPLLDLLNVKYVLTEHEIDNPRYTLVYDGEIRVYRNEGAMPRAFTLPEHSAVVVEDVGQAVQQYDPRNYVILEAGSWELEPTTSNPGIPQPAIITWYSHNEVLVDVALDAPGWLVLADSYFPGWRAYVRPQDAGEGAEQSVPILRAAGNFRAVHLPAGQHTVRFKYTPDSVKVGFFISFLAVMALLLLIGVWLWRRFYRADNQESTVRRVTKNSLAPIVLQLFNKAIDTAFTALMLRILAPEAAGQYYFITANVIVSLDIFINFGLNTLLQREVAKVGGPGQEGGRRAANRYLVNALALRGGLLGLAAPLLAGFIVGWSALIEPLGATQVWALALFAIGLVPGAVSAAFTALFNGFEDMEYPAAITTVTTILRVALGTGVLLLGWGIVGLGATSIAVNMVTLSVLATLAVRRYFRPRWDADSALRQEMAHQSYPLMINDFLSLQFFKVDVPILKALWGDAAVGLYTAASYRIVDAINIIPASFTFALFPLMSRYAANDRESLPRAYGLAVRILVIVALPIAVLTTVLAYPLAAIIGGTRYLPDSAIALQLMIWSIPVGFINSVTHYVLIALNQQRYLTRCFVVGVVFSAGSNLLLIPVFGYRAAGVLHLFSELTLLVAFYLGLRRHMCPVPWVHLLWRPALAGAIMGGTALMLYGVHPLLAAFAALIVYAVALVTVGTFRDPDMRLVTQFLPARERRQLTQSAPEKSR